MRFIFIPVTLLAALQFCYAQKTELTITAATGLFFFRGSGAVNNTTVYTSAFYSPGSSALNPYGKKAGFSYTVGLQLQRLTSKKIIYGMGLAFEALTSRASIDSVYESPEVILSQYRTIYPAKGITRLHNNFITFAAFAGHRYNYKRIFFDITAGLELGLYLNGRSTGTADYNIVNSKRHLQFDNAIEMPAVDIRPAVKLKIMYNKLGLAAGYSAGLSNFRRDGKTKAFTSFLQLGIVYQLK
jgi:hypothetical protein